MLSPLVNVNVSSDTETSLNFALSLVCNAVILLALVLALASIAPILFDTVVAKLGSFPKALANSFNVSKVVGALFTSLATSAAAIGFTSS